MDVFFAAMAITVAVNVLLILNTAALGSDDDLGIALALSGIYPESGQCLFTNAVLNELVFALNSWQPSLNWLLIMERISSTCAFFALCYCMLRYVPTPIALTVLGFMSYFIMPKCTVAANFTVVAALCIFAGELYFCEGLARGRISPCISGLALVLLGYMWRALVLMLSVPFLALASLIIVFRYRMRGGRFLRLLAFRALGALIATGLLVGCAYFYDASIWEQPEWSSWKTYNLARCELVDYPVLPYEKVKDELSSIGVSSSEYWLMTNWITADPDVMTTDKLQEVASIAREPMSDRSLLDALLAECKHLIEAILFTGYMALIGVLVGLWGGRRSAAVACLSFLGALGVCVMFRYTGRLPMRVEYATWLFSFLPLATGVLSIDGMAPLSSNPRRNRCREVAAGLGIGLAALCIAGMLIKWIPTFDSAEIAQFEQDNSSMQEERLIERFTKPGTVFVWDTTTFIQIEDALHCRYLPPRSMMASTVMAGGWTQRAPFVEAHNEALGASNPLKSLVERPDTFFVTRQKKAIENLLQYLRERYNEKTKYEIVEQVPLDDREAKPILIVKFSTDQSTDEEEQH